MTNLKYIFAAVGISAILPLMSLAAGANLYNGGFGQTAGNTAQFGIAVCNGGTVAVNQSVPVTVAVGGQTVTLSSATSIAPGACDYSYAQYSGLDMQAGKTYSVVATIDPSHSVISNSNNQATYSVTVPGGANNGTANVNAQSGNFFTAILNWFEHLF